MSIRGHIALVVNVFGGPGVGKTTTAARIFTALKMRAIDSELIDEVARTCIQTGQLGALEIQPYLFGQSLYRLKTTARNTDVVIMDAPLLLNPIYDKRQSPGLRALCWEEHQLFPNLNIVLDRPNHVKHSMVGRIHDLDQSENLHNDIVRFLDEIKLPYVRMRADDGGVEQIADWVCGLLPQIRQNPLSFPPGPGIIPEGGVGVVSLFP